LLLCEKIVCGNRRGGVVFFFSEMSDNIGGRLNFKKKCYELKL